MQADQKDELNGLMEMLYGRVRLVLTNKDGGYLCEWVGDEKFHAAYAGKPENAEIWLDNKQVYSWPLPVEYHMTYGDTLSLEGAARYFVCDIYKLIEEGKLVRDLD